MNPDDPDIEILDVNTTAGEGDAVEGLWINPDSSIQLRIKKFPGNGYKAIIVKAKDEKLRKGLVYFSLRPASEGIFAEAV